MAWILGFSAATGAILGLGFTHAFLMSIFSMVLALVVAIWALESAYPHIVLLPLLSVIVHQMAYLAFGLLRVIWMEDAHGLRETDHFETQCSDPREWTKRGNASKERANL